MCGRFANHHPRDDIAKAFDADELPFIDSSYNIAPGQDVLVICANNGRRVGQKMKWGLVPGWAKDPSIGNRMINARSETVAVKPAFRMPFRKRRCLVVTSGFFEWTNAGTYKQPHYIRLRDNKPFGFAGLWDSWQIGNGNALLTCTILTTNANQTVRSIHDRMPVIIDPTEYTRWLDTDVTNPDDLTDLLRPYWDEEVVSYPVSRLVNKPANNSRECVQPLEVDNGGE